MGKDLARLHTRALAEGFHIPPNVAPIQGPTRPGGEHRPGGLFLCFQIVPQKPPQFIREKYGAALALVGDLRPARLHGLGGDEAEFRNPYAGGADGLQDQGETLIALPLGGMDQAGVLAPGQFFVFV